MEIGNWRIDDGRKNVAETFRFPLNRRWKMEIGRWKVEIGGWRVEVGKENGMENNEDRIGQRDEGSRAKALRYV